MSDPNQIVQRHLKRIVEHSATLTRSEAAELLRAVFHADDSPAAHLRIAALLGALAARGETAAEIAGFVDAMRAAATPVPVDEPERALLVDTCGTGGDQSGTFNISTAAALVAAAAGARVAKHGNRAVTSRSGSADVLEALGIPVDLDPEEAATALRTHGFAFLHAPTLHPALRTVMPIRRALGVRTVFNILGPMSNPAGAPAQVMGVYAARLVPLVAEALATLGTRHAFVVHGAGELDEISLCGPSQIAEIRDGKVTLSTFVPEDVGLQQAPLQALAGGDATANAAILRAIFAGQTGAPRDVVVLNAAAVLVTAALAPNLRAGVELAQRTIDSGQVTALVLRLSQ
ncbi:anthranilate phosphoribosyltransferase [Granulicella sp. WH15]|uniref:anthranilate phosphoribosyltransferase n=1 Tax=Granulicella sp. WH15 TaxID=2602070 RepID=UPI001366F472|nr:anthranilate phosphoribosyltransferase [Granulicella sp. WH15]QHN04950.1 anthranilate phosphoribosyltransferase [Granulicella sp. WH15]